MSLGTRTTNLGRKPRRRSGGTAYRFGTKNNHQHHHSHQCRDHRNRRASAPILTPYYSRFIRISSPISRSAETVALPIPSPILQTSPSKSASFSAEVEDMFIQRPECLSVHMSVGDIFHAYHNHTSVLSLVLALCCVQILHISFCV